MPLVAYYPHLSASITESSQLAYLSACHYFKLMSDLQLRVFVPLEGILLGLPVNRI